MRVAHILVISSLILTGCHRDGDTPVACMELGKGTSHEAVIAVARKLSEEGFFKIESSFNSENGPIPNIGLYKFDGTKIYFIGEIVASDGFIYPADISIYGDVENEALTGYVNSILSLLDQHKVQIKSVCDMDITDIDTS